MATGKRNARKDEKAARARPAAVAPEQWPAWRIERKPIEWLKPHPRNVRTHPVRQLTELDLSFAEHGAVRPFVANTEGHILAGHGSKDSVEHLHGRGIEVPVIVVDWPEHQQRAFMLRDNATALLSGWDAERLGIELADLRTLATVDVNQAVDVNHLGFRPSELKKLIPEPLREGLTDPDAEAPPAPSEGEAVSRIGDVWLLGEHRLMCGDSTKRDHVEVLLAGARPHLMVTDPPYGVNYDPTWRDEASANSASMAGKGPVQARGLVANDDRADWREAWALFGGDVAYVWHASLFGPEVAASLEACGFERRCQIIWNKNKHTIGRADYQWKHEPCWYMVRKGATGHWQGSRGEFSVWDIASLAGPDGLKQDMLTGHGTQKPIECMSRPMRNNSKPGDFIYEPFSGSGTTIIAGEQLDRRVLAMEMTPAYVDVAVTRWAGFTGKTAILAAGGKGRAEVAAERGIKIAA